MVRGARKQADSAALRVIDAGAGADDNVAYEEEEFDERFGMPGLHTINRRVEFVERPTVLPPEIFCKYIDSNFWLNEKLNTKGVLVL